MHGGTTSAGAGRPLLTHLALHVRDAGKALEFYREWCGLRVVHERDAAGSPVVWLAEAGAAPTFVLVLIPGGSPRPQEPDDYGHIGFAMASRAEVDAVAARAAAAGVLLWPPREEPYPVGYYCGVRDPDGRAVEFSFGQPLGPRGP